MTYALAVLLDETGQRFQWPAWLVYGEAADERDAPRVRIVPGGLFSEKYGTPASLPTLPLAEIEGVPLLFGRPAVQRDGNTLVIQADIIASTYFLVTRYEEWVRREVRDQHGRFPGRESLPFRAGFLQRPVIDEYAGLLRRWVGDMGIELPRSPRKFSVLLTHDVDLIGPPRGPLRAARRVAGGLVGRQLFGQALVGALIALGLKRHPYDNLEEVMRLDGHLTHRFPDRCGAVYFFLADGDSLRSGGYDVASARIRNRMQRVMRSGGAIGLHASYEAGREPGRVGIERQTLERAVGVPIEKNRHHILAWREPEHGAAIAQGGIRWDMTLGYADVAGFRLGVCRPIRLFDPHEQKLLGIEEHPLALMDCTLDRPEYMNLDEEAAFECARRLMDVTACHNGEFVCLWHNSLLAKNDPSYHGRLYRRVLQHLEALIEHSPAVHCPQVRDAAFPQD